jgi:hypothetical protein
VRGGKIGQQSDILRREFWPDELVAYIRELIAPHWLRAADLTQHVVGCFLVKSLV